MNRHGGQPGKKIRKKLRKIIGWRVRRGDFSRGARPAGLERAFP